MSFIRKVIGQFCCQCQCQFPLREFDIEGPVAENCPKCCHEICGDCGLVEGFQNDEMIAEVVGGN